MAVPVSDEFITALSSRKRQIRVKGQINNRTGGERFGPLTILDGEVTIDWTQHLEGPVHQAAITVADPDRELFPDLSEGDASNIWFSCRLYLTYGLRLPDGSWEDIPIFSGPINEMTRDGESLQITAVGKETHQQPPSAFFHSYQVDAGTTFSQAIIDLLLHRGIDDVLLDDIETEDDDASAHRNYHFGLGQSPWKALHFFAKHLDKQIFYRAGKPVLRAWPIEPDWTFVKGADSIVLDWPAQRLSMTDFFNQAYVISDKIVDDGPLDATRPEPVMGYAELGDSNPLSAHVLTNNNKPQIRIWERHASTFLRADQIAQQYLDGAATGLDAEITISCLPLPHLEPMDIVRLDFGASGVDLHSFRIKNFNIPLTPDGTMQINWQGHRVPHHRSLHTGGRGRHHGVVPGR